MQKKILILGAGISGLTCAYFLKKNGADVTVLEAAERPGGAMQSKRIDGFLVERGPNSTQETTELFDEIINDLGITEEKIYAEESAKYRYVLRNGKLHAMPLNPPLFLKTKLFSLPAKLRLLAEPFIGKAQKEESVAEFVERRLGKEFLDYAINPFVAGVYAGDPRQLSVRHAFPKLFALEENYGGLFKGMLAKRKEKKNSPGKNSSEKISTQPAGKMFAFKNGMGTLTQALANYLGDSLLLNSPVKKISFYGGKFSVETGEKIFETDKIVIALPAYIAAELLKNFSSETADALNKIFYPPVCEVVLGYKKEQVGTPLDGFGFLIPEKEKRKILGCIWSSSIFKHRAPENFVEMTTFVGGVRNPEIARKPDDELKKIVSEELSDLLKISGEPAFTHISRWERAIPQYNLGYEKILSALAVCEEKFPGLYFCSNYRGGVSVGDCVKNAKKVSELVGR